MDQKRAKVVQVESVDSMKSLINNAEAEGYQFQDLFDCQVEELIELSCLEAPERLKVKIRDYKDSHLGCLVFFPWAKKIVRVLEENDYFSLLTSRNRNLITESEQEDYRQATLAIAGLSVGSNIALSVVMQGGCKKIKIADADQISTSNMNRIITSILLVNVDKTAALAQKLYEVNPFIEVEIFQEGLNETNIEEFITGAQVVFDEIDSLDLKYSLRLATKSKRIPLVMITDNGDNIMIDIERYDERDDLKPFHGLLSDSDLLAIQQSRGKILPQDRVRLSLKIVQPQNAVSRMQESLLEVGRSLKTWPQLATASWLAGTAGSYIVRRIVNQQPLVEGRFHLSLDSLLIPEYNSQSSKEDRLLKTEEFLRKMR